MHRESRLCNISTSRFANKLFLTKPICVRAFAGLQQQKIPQYQSGHGRSDLKFGYSRIITEGTLDVPRKRLENGVLAPEG